MKPARGTECAECRRKGHRCEATILVDDEPLCLNCADGEPCVAARCAGNGRELSSARVEENAFGEIVDVGIGCAPVITRTPEELGLPRTVPHVRPRKDIRPDPFDRPAAAPMALAGVKRDPADLHVHVATRVIDEERDQVEEVVEEGTRDTMPIGKHGYKTPEDVKVKILAEPAGARASELAKKYDVSEGTIYNLRAKGKSPLMRAKPGRRMKSVALARPVEIDPQRAGTASSLLGALDKMNGHAEAKIALELGAGDVALIFGKFNESQKTAFLSAGLRAALLA